MSYRRVIPRDLFNESKLLKCLGRVVLLIGEGKLPLTYRLTDENGDWHDDTLDEPFEILQDASDGGLFVKNLQFFSRSGRAILFKSILNDQSAYPLVAVTPDDGEVLVLLEDGSPDPHFLMFLQSEDL